MLRGLSIHILAGATTTLAGPSGSRKTTITRLIARFEDPDSGTLRIGGVDLRELPHAEVMRQVSIVFQDAYLFEGTIKDNVRLAARRPPHNSCMPQPRLRGSTRSLTGWPPDGPPASMNAACRCPAGSANLCPSPERAAARPR